MKITKQQLKTTEMRKANEEIRQRKKDKPTTGKSNKG